MNLYVNIYPACDAILNGVPSHFKTLKQAWVQIRLEDAFDVVSSPPLVLLTGKKMKRIWGGKREKRSQRTKLV